jgi:hypothetical protein
MEGTIRNFCSFVIICVTRSASWVAAYGALDAVRLRADRWRVTDVLQ